MPDHRLGTVLTADPATGLCDVTVAGTVVTAKALGFLPVAGQQVWVEQRGTLKQDWVITDVHDLPMQQAVTGQLIMAPNAGDITSGSATDVLTISPAITIPVWARDGTHFLWVKAICNPVVITAAGQFPVRVVIGGTAPDEGLTNTQAQFYGDATNQSTIIAAGTFTIAAATTSLAPKVQAWRTAGTGAIRFNTASIPSPIIWEWKIY